MIELKEPSSLPANFDKCCLEAAKKYIAMNFYLIPVNKIQDDKCACGKDKCDKPGKHPATPNGFKNATNDIRQITAWFKNNRYNIAIVTGKISGIIVLDIDPRHGGDESLLRLGELPATLMVHTGGGGRHLFFKYPPHVTFIKNTAGRLDNGLDIRGDAGYVVTAPSNHISGGTYYWDDIDAEIADLPQHLLDRILALQNNASKPSSSKNDVAPILEGGRNDRLMSIGGTLIKKGLTENVIRSTLQEVNQEQCDPPLSSEEVDKIVRSVMRYRTHDEIDFTDNNKSSDTDLGNAQLFVARHGENIRYCHSHGKWYTYTGKYWQPDVCNKIMQLAIETIEHLSFGDWRFILADGDPKKAEKEYKKHIKNSRQNSKLKALVEVASSLEEVVILPEHLDTHKWLLNFENGTLDLHDGMLKPHCKEDYITKILPHSYNPEATCPIFTRFMEDITCNRLGMVFYLQQITGYCLTGDTREHAAFFLIGSGANGKSTFVDILHYLLGSYAESTPMATLAKRKTDRIRSDIAGLVGVRLATVVEWSEHEILDEGMFKRITGGDIVKERLLYKEYFASITSCGS